LAQWHEGKGYHTNDSKIAKRRNCTDKKALENEFWVTHLNTQEGLSVDHIVQLYKLWEKTQHVHLEIHTLDLIKWKFGKDVYSATLAYNWVILPLQCLPWFGGLAILSNVGPLSGSCIKTVCGRQIDYINGVAKLWPMQALQPSQKIGHVPPSPLSVLPKNLDKLED
jgi:hypothetical protein